MSRKSWLLIVVAFVAMAAIGRAATRRRRQDAANPSQAVKRVRALYDRGARRYELAMEVLDDCFSPPAGGGWLGRRVGTVLELAAGSGRNFPHYGREARLTAQDIRLAP